jgi:hypothetical protein
MENTSAMSDRLMRTAHLAYPKGRAGTSSRYRLLTFMAVLIDLDRSRSRLICPTDYCCRVSVYVAGSAASRPILKISRTTHNAHMLMENDSEGGGVFLKSEYQQKISYGLIGAHGGREGVSHATSARRSSPSTRRTCGCGYTYSWILTTHVTAHTAVSARSACAGMGLRYAGVFPTV